MGKIAQVFFLKLLDLKKTERNAPIKCKVADVAAPYTTMFFSHDKCLKSKLLHRTVQPILSKSKMILNCEHLAVLFLEIILPTLALK